MTGRRWRPVVVGLAASAHACAASGQWAVEPMWSTDAPEMSVTTRLLPVADVTVHNGERWRDRSLADQNWLMVGSNGVGDVWFTYLEFDLGPVSLATPIREALLQLRANTSLVLPQDGRDYEVSIHAVPDDWSESSITWLEQPKVESEPVHSFTILAGSGSTTVDLTDVVISCLDRGQTRLSLLLAPADPGRDFRVRWFSREAPVEDDPTVQIDGPTQFRRVGGPSTWALRNDALQISLVLASNPGLGTERP